MPPYDEYSSLWEGNSPNATHAYERMKAAGQAPDNSWLERLFGGGQRPAPYTPAPTDEGRFPESPFTAPPPQAKPVSKLSSAADLGTRIRQIVQQPWQGEGDTATFEPIRRTQQAWQGEGDTEAPGPQGDPLAMAVNQYPAQEPPPARVPIDMRDAPSPFTSASLAGLPSSVKRAVSELLGGGNRFGGNTFGGQKFGGAEYGGNRFGGNQFGGNRFGASSAGPGETGGEPMMEAAPLPYGGGTYGGNVFGGNTYGGNRFGGEKFGGRRFGASKAHGGSVHGYDAGGFYEGPFGSSDQIPEMEGLPGPIQSMPVQQAAFAVPPPPPVMPPSGGKEGGGGGGMGDIASMAMKFLPMLLNKGGDVPGFMRGGYPELRTAPIRHQFDSGGQSYVDGDSDGRADDIDARLSSGEYVLDGETVAMLGNGNPKAGAKKMDQFRVNVRKHKGAALAKGKISADAKSPAEYLIGSPQSDGIRRHGKK